MFRYSGSYLGTNLRILQRIFNKLQRWANTTEFNFSSSKRGNLSKLHSYASAHLYLNDKPIKVTKRSEIHKTAWSTLRQKTYLENAHLIPKQRMQQQIKCPQNNTCKQLGSRLENSYPLLIKP